MLDILSMPIGDAFHNFSKIREYFDNCSPLYLVRLCEMCENIESRYIEVSGSILYALAIWISCLSSEYKQKLNIFEVCRLRLNNTFKGFNGTQLSYLKSMIDYLNEDLNMQAVTDLEVFAWFKEFFIAKICSRFESLEVTCKWGLPFVPISNSTVTSPVVDGTVYICSSCLRSSDSIRIAGTYFTDCKV